MIILKRTHDRIAAGLQAELTMTRRAYRVAEAKRKRAVIESARLIGERNAALDRAKSAEAAYHGLVEKMLTPPKAPLPVVHPEPEAAALTAISDDTVKRMTEQFVRDGLAPDVADKHARELVELAERSWSLDASL